MENVISSEHVDRLDETDLHIINAMRTDGRVAFAQIAEQLNVSPGMIRQRYNRLVELGYLKVVAVTNPLMMGKRTMAMIGVRTDGRKMQINLSNLTKSFTLSLSAADTTSWSRSFAVTMKTCSNF